MARLAPSRLSLLLIAPTAAFIAAAIALPLAHAVVVALQHTLARGSTASDTSAVVVPAIAPALAASLGWALSIAALSTLIAILPAWLIRRNRSWLVALIPLPLLMPTYLAYAGLSILRAPRTPIGDWLIHLATTAEPGSLPTSAPMIAAKLTALLGLTLCLWPIPALLIGLRLQRVGDDTLDALALDVPSPLRRALALARLLAPSITLSITAVGLICLGSAVPLHLAQAKTLALRVWLALAQLPPAEHHRAWLAAWPLVLIAAAAAVAISIALVKPIRDTLDPPKLSRPAPASASIITVLLLTLGIALPLGLFASVLTSPADLPKFWTLSSRAVTDAAITAALIAPVGMLIAAAFAHAASNLSRPRPARLSLWTTRAALALLLIAGLMPGVLIASALASFYTPTPAIADTRAILILAAIARFGWVPALLGLWIARSEPPARLDLAQSDGVRSPLARLATLTPAHRAALAAAGLILALLSLHEIEAAVILTPVGTRSLARQFLDELHFLRLDALAAGVIQIVGVGIVLALAAGIALQIATRPPTQLRSDSE